jgi:uncharacterized protein YndB with AHSA1/START domain
MNTQELIAHAEVSINAGTKKVWEALTKPEIIKKYMFGTTVNSDWKVGSMITWKGEWKGKQYEDRGIICQFRPEKLIQYTHFSPLAGLPDIPENYHLVTIELTQKGENTLVSLSQDNNETEEAKHHAEKNWSSMLSGLKKVLEEKDQF